MFFDSDFFFQAEDGIRYLVRSRGLGDVYKRQGSIRANTSATTMSRPGWPKRSASSWTQGRGPWWSCLLYTSDAADELLCVDLGGRRIIKKKNKSLTPDVSLP